MDATYWLDRLRQVFLGRRVIVKCEVVAAATPTVRSLRELGAEAVMVVATNGPGLGELPDETDALTISLDVVVEGQQAGEAIRAGNRAIAQLPAWVHRAVDGFDPDHGAIAVGDFLNESEDIAGRRFLSYRRPEWLALDDKTVVDGLWDRVGVERANSAIVPAEVDSVRAVFETFNVGSGVVVAIDARDGWTGGAEGTRWARTAEDVTVALSGWTGGDRRVRVMPFLEGIPCSIHGVVFDEHVITLRPVEMIVLRSGSSGFVYAGCASFFDPPDRDRASMRHIAQAVGIALRGEVQYRGAFTVDGVMTADGFRPTELNTRNGGGLTTMVRGLPEHFPMQLLLDAVGAGVEADWRPDRLEEALLASFDTDRCGGTWKAFPVDVAESSDWRLVRGAGVASGLRPANGDEPHDVHIAFGPSPIGTFIRATFVSDRMSIGTSAAPLAADVWEFLDGRLGLGLGKLAPALDVCDSGSSG